MGKVFKTAWVYEPLEGHISFFVKPMFGGLAVYYNDLMVLVLMESKGDREWKGQKFDFDLWDGLMLCTSREQHPSLVEDFPELRPHPVLGKWLFLSADLDEFEEVAVQLAERIKDKDPRMGIVPGTRKKSKKASTKKSVGKKKSKKTKAKKSEVKTKSKKPKPPKKSKKSKSKVS